MKKLKSVALSLLVAITLSSCATILGGKVTTCQKTKPAPGQPQREIRVGYLILDILLFTPATIVDFATAAIYKPCQ